MERSEILEREQRWALPAGLAAIAILPIYIASTLIEGQTQIFEFELGTERLRAIDAGADPLLVSAILRALGFLLMIPPLLYLFRAAQARSERVSPAMLGFVFAGPMLAAGWAVVWTLGRVDLASEFVAQASRGGDIYTLVEDLGESSSLVEIGAGLMFPAALGLVVGLIYIPLQALRVGLLTRFVATLGMALGAGLVVFGPVFAPLVMVLTFWLAWLGFTFLGRVPNGPPPAWEAGRAIPWPRPGEEPEAAADSNGTPEEPADARELVAPAAKDRSERRARARKKKRKRRG